MSFYVSEKYIQKTTGCHQLSVCFDTFELWKKTA